MKGYERKIIMLKGTDSEIFDEAYFLIRRDFKEEKGAEIVREAQRIVDMNTTRRRAQSKRKREWIAFAVGAFAGFALGLICLII